MIIEKVVALLKEGDGLGLMLMESHPHLEKQVLEAAKGAAIVFSTKTNRGACYNCPLIKLEAEGYRVARNSCSLEKGLGYYSVSFGNAHEWGIAGMQDGVVELKPMCNKRVRYQYRMMMGFRRKDKGAVKGQLSLFD